jgi:hypothetical protein
MVLAISGSKGLAIAVSAHPPFHVLTDNTSNHDSWAPPALLFSLIII